MPRSSRGGFDKFEAQDHVIESFRKFATEKLVGLLLGYPIYYSTLLHSLHCYVKWLKSGECYFGDPSSKGRRSHASSHGVDIRHSESNTGGRHSHDIAGETQLNTFLLLPLLVIWRACNVENIIIPPFECILIMHVQRVEGETSVDVRKNRFDGTLGSVSVQFNSATSTFYETEK